MMLENQTIVSQNMPFQLFEAITLTSNDGLAFRLYPDNRPTNLEIAPLQKGLVLIRSGEELVEEGAGFGAPIAKYDDKAYFSRTAEVFVDKQNDDYVLLRKVFSLDAVSRKQLQGALVNENFYSFFHKMFERAYLSRHGFRPVFDWAIGIRKTIGVTTQFLKVSSKGKVSVSYKCYPDRIEVTVDFSELNTKNCVQLLLLNEQGAVTFRRFADSEGHVLYDSQIGAWMSVTAKWARFSDLKDKVSFAVEKQANATIYRGREQIKDRFSWSGLTYALKPSVKSFKYSIKTRLSAN